MRCEDLHIELSAWIDGELAVAERGLVTAHLQTCPACRDYLRELQDISALARALPRLPEPESITREALRELYAVKRQGVTPWAPRRRLSWALSRAALSAGLVGLVAAAGLAVFIGQHEWTKTPAATTDTLNSAANNAPNREHGDDGYRLSSAPDDAAGPDGTPIGKGYDFRDPQGPTRTRDIHAFNARERFAWDHGLWHHERRFGRDGWWWDVEGASYWYAQPFGGPPPYVSAIRFAMDSGPIGPSSRRPTAAKTPPQQEQ